MLTCTRICAERKVHNVFAAETHIVIRTT